MCAEDDSCTDLISSLNEKICFITGLVVLSLLSPLLLVKGISLDRIVGWVVRVSNIFFRMLPVIFLPFFVMHELLHFVFMSVALLHPGIKFLGWIKPTFHTAETFSTGMRLGLPGEEESSVAVHIFVLFICLAPALGFIPAMWAIRQTINPYLLVYLILGVLWCVPSSGDRMAIRDTVNSLLYTKRNA